MADIALSFQEVVGCSLIWHVAALSRAASPPPARCRGAEAQRARRKRLQQAVAASKLDAAPSSRRPMLSDTFDHFGDSDRGGLGPGGGENVYAERAPITDLPQPELGCAMRALSCVEPNAGDADTRAAAQDAA